MQSHTGTRVLARDVKNKGRSGTESHKRRRGAPHVLTPYSSTSNWFPIQSGSPPTLEMCSEMEAELGLAETGVCVLSQVTQLGSSEHSRHGEG